MGHTPAIMTSSLRAFSEREFYLAEFRGRSIAIAWPDAVPAEREPLATVIETLASSGSRVVLLSSQEKLFEEVEVPCVGAVSDAGYPAALWRGLRERGRAGLALPGDGFEAACERVALALRLAKVVWIQENPPIERHGEEPRVSVVDLAHLEPLLSPGVAGGAEGQRVSAGSEALLRSIRALIEGGIPSVNVCAPRDLARELFTYAGAGTFFTRDRYAEVRPLALDDYDLADDLIGRGEADGYLAPRDQAARDAVLAHGVGVFIEGRYLAGIGAILPYPDDDAVELASLFALTRYVGEGAGGQIVRYAIDRARADGLTYLFSCTTSERVEGFFTRLGFERVGHDAVPAAKWTDYDPSRRERVRCLRFDL